MRRVSVHLLPPSVPSVVTPQTSTCQGHASADHLRGSPASDQRGQCVNPDQDTLLIALRHATQFHESEPLAQAVELQGGLLQRPATEPTVDRHTSDQVVQRPEGERLPFSAEELSAIAGSALLQG